MSLEPPQSFSSPWRRSFLRSRWLLHWRACWLGHGPDRVLALDTMYINAMLLILTFGVAGGTRQFFEAALAIGMLGHVSTAAAAEFLLRGEVIE